MGFYADKLEKAVAMALNQQKEGWLNAEIRQYWILLEGEVFAENVMEHLN